MKYSLFLNQSENPVIPHTSQGDIRDSAIIGANSKGDSDVKEASVKSKSKKNGGKLKNKRRKIPYFPLGTSRPWKTSPPFGRV